MVGVSTSMGICNTHLQQFNEKNYDYWAIIIKALFASQDLWEFVEDGFEEPADEDEFNNLTQAEKELLKSYKKKDSKDLYLLYQAVHESVFPRIAAAKTSKEAWKTLKIAYQGMEKVKTTKLQLLGRDFENLWMKESDNIDSFFTHVIGMVTQIRSYGEIFEERRIVEKLLRILPSRFDVIVTTIEETNDLTNFLVDELYVSLMTHEQRLNRNENSSLEHAFKTQMLEEEEVKAEETRKEETETKIEVEETVQQMLKEEAAIQIGTKAKAATNKVDNIMLKDKGMINPMSNVTIVKNMGIMQMNVRRSSMI